MARQAIAGTADWRSMERDRWGGHWLGHVKAMGHSKANHKERSSYWRDLGRAFGGALLFSLPLLMTMEMWQLGMTLEPWRQLLFLLASLPVLFGLAHYAGFTPSRSGWDNLIEVAAALFVAAVTGAVLLALTGAWEMGNLRVSTGQLTLQLVPAAIGALLARKQLAADSKQNRVRKGDYLGELFLMMAGALFLALSLAPTEEMQLIAYRIGPEATLAVMGLSMLLLHIFVFEVGFAGQEERETPIGALLHFTVPGYGICLLVCMGILSLLGMNDAHGTGAIMANTVVLAFPASLGAAAARLLV